jgi:hypothetical protein
MPTRRLPARKTVLAFLGGLGVAAGLTACGSSNHTTTKTNTPGATSPAPTTGAPTTATPTTPASTTPPTTAPSGGGVSY